MKRGQSWYCCVTCERRDRLRRKSEPAEPFSPPISPKALPCYRFSIASQSLRQTESGRGASIVCTGRAANQGGSNRASTRVGNWCRRLIFRRGGARREGL